MFKATDGTLSAIFTKDDTEIIVEVTAKGSHASEAIRVAEIIDGFEKRGYLLHTCNQQVNYEPDEAM
jgi:hypothetical protein